MKWKQLLKPFSLAFIIQLITLNSTFASLLTFDLEAINGYEQERTYNFNSSEWSYGDTQYTPIAPVNLNLIYEIDFNSAPTDSAMWDTLDHRGHSNEEVYNGKHYSTYSSYFRADLITPETPFTDELKSLMPEEDDSPEFRSSTGPSIHFFSEVVTDIATGDIIQDESKEYFKLTHGEGFKNFDELAYFHKIKVWMFLPTIFSQNVANQYSISDLKAMLSSREDFDITYNEQIEISDDSNVDYYNQTVIGYTAQGTHTFSVPEPTSLMIFTLAIMGLFSKRMKS